MKALGLSAAQFAAYADLDFDAASRKCEELCIPGIEAEEELVKAEESLGRKKQRVTICGVLLRSCLLCSDFESRGIVSRAGRQRQIEDARACRLEAHRAANGTTVAPQP